MKDKYVSMLNRYYRRKSLWYRFWIVIPVIFTLGYLVFLVIFAKNSGIF